jgi:hypothetical protein
MTAPRNTCVCFICRRKTDGFGVSMTHWICDDENIRIARALSKMAKNKFDAFEVRAIEDMSPKLGEWIDKTIGSTDFATWNEQQWFDFLKRAVTQFGESMRAVTAALEPPF